MGRDDKSRAAVRQKAEASECPYGWFLGLGGCLEPYEGWLQSELEPAGGKGEGGWMDKQQPDHPVFFITLFPFWYRSPTIEVI